MWRFPLTLRVLTLLMWCRSVRKNLGTRPLRLPPIAPERTVDEQSVERQVRFADRIIGALTSRTGHFCFYRSVTLAVLFREQGLPVIVNMGARSVHAPARTKAHSWLTLEGKPFFEQPNAVALYTLDMGTNTDGSIRYWVGPDFDGSMLARDDVARGNASRPAVCTPHH